METCWPVSDYSSSPEGKLTKVVYILERAYGVIVVGICFGLTVPCPVPGTPLPTFLPSYAIIETRSELCKELFT